MMVLLMNGDAAVVVVVEMEGGESGVRLMTQ